MPSGLWSRARPVLERFEEKFIPEPNSGCWLWVAGARERPDGLLQAMFCFDGNTRGSEAAARSAWKIYRGTIPEGLHILHKCDTSLCVNPNHLYPGTHHRNMLDRKERFRQWKDLDPEAWNAHWTKHRFRATGEKHPSARLTAEQVLEIRTVKEKARITAARYGMHKETILRIRQGRIWAQGPWP